MKSIFLLLVIATLNGQAQTPDCYEIVVKGSVLSTSVIRWNDLTISGPKDKLIRFLRTDKLFASCDYIYQSPDQIMEKAKKIDCPGDIIRLEFKVPKDVLQLRKELKKSESTKKTSPDPIKNNNALTWSTVEVCVNSDGEITLTYGNEFGTIQVTSKGKFSLSTKKEDGTEYKVEL